MAIMNYRDSRGFTAVELVAAIVVLLAATGLAVWQRNDINAATRDSERKTSINAMYYSLEEAYYPANGNAYPERLNVDTLNGLDPALLADPDGKKIGDSGSSLRYEPRNCANGKCRGYTLRADLEKEADFVKDSRRN